MNVFQLVNSGITVSNQDRKQTEQRIKSTACLLTPKPVTPKLIHDESRLSRLPVLCFEFENGQKVTIQELRCIVIGRRVDARDRVNFDLTEYGGYEGGVSRTHAAIQYTYDGILLRDLNSSNGTFVNGKQLYPMQVYLLQDGDYLGFGKMKLRVRFE